MSNSKLGNVSLLCFISIEGVVYYDIKIGSYLSSDLENIIEKKIKISDPLNKKFLICDNAAIHKTLKVKEAAIKKNYILKFQPAYSPQLNPTENFFHQLKSMYKRIDPSPKTHNEIIERLNFILKEKEFNMEGYYNNMRRWIDSARKNLNF